MNVDLETIVEEINCFFFAIFLRNYATSDFEQQKKKFFLMLSKVWRDPSVIALIVQEGELWARNSEHDSTVYYANDIGIAKKVILPNNPNKFRYSPS